MNPPRPYSAVPFAIAALIGAGFFFAFVGAHDYFAELEFLRDLPRATLAAPVKGPAIYAGRLVGPAERKTLTQQSAAAHFWSVTVGGGKSRTLKCFEWEVDRLELRDNEGHALPYLGLVNRKLSVVSDDRGHDWSHRDVVDLGPLKSHKPAGLPAQAQRCQGSSAGYVEQRIPPNTEVEVLACYRDGALHACDAPLRNVLSVPNLMVHRVRRAERAYLAFVVVSGLSTMLLGVLFVLSLRARKRTVQPLRPGEAP